MTNSLWQQVGDGGIQATPTELAPWGAQYWEPTVGGADIDRRRFDGAVAAGGMGRYGAGITEVDIDGIGRVLSHAGGWGGFLTLFMVAPDARGRRGRHLYERRHRGVARHGLGGRTARAVGRRQAMRAPRGRDTP